MRFLSLFAGIGAFDLGCERAGWTCAGQVEIDPFCQRVLAKHWPNVPRWQDVRSVQAVDVVARCGAIDCIIGGFPCQPWSFAGKGKGADDPRHLWPEYARLIRELRPQWVIGENVPGLRSRGADLVLSDLEALGYTCWPLVVGADDAGAPHRRKRVWIVAHASGEHSAGWRGVGDMASSPRADACEARQRQRLRGAAGDGGADVGNSNCLRQQQPSGDFLESWRWPSNPGETQYSWEEPRTLESAVGSTIDGPARRLARWRRASLKALGNAVVPQVAYLIAAGVTKAGRQ